MRAWAFGDGQGRSRSDGVRLVALNDGGGSRAVGGVRRDSLSRGDPDGWDPGAIGWRWGHWRVRRRNNWGGSWLAPGNSVREGAWAVCDILEGGKSRS